jgi:hypothetical protein
MSTQTLSAGRPGAGSAVVQDDATPRTVNVAGVGVVQTGTSGGGGGGTTQARVWVMA